MIPTQYLIEKVLAILNEPYHENSITLLSEDTRSLHDTILELLPDAVLFVQNNKVYGTLNPKVYNVPEGAITDNGDGSGSVLLPSDFVNLLEMRLDGWERPCTVLAPSGSPIALAQGNIYTRGGCSKPVCVDAVNSAGARVVEYYSLPKGKSPVVKNFVYEALYEPQAGLSCNDGNPLVCAVAYQCAGLLYNVFERANAAASFMALALSMCKNGNKT